MLSKFERKDDIPSELVLDKKPKHPLRAEVKFMPDLMSPAESQAKMGITFVCNQMCDDPYETFKLQVLSALLFEGPNSLFYKTIIEGDVAPNFCPGYGYDNTTRQSTFTVGVQGIET